MPQLRFPPAFADTFPEEGSFSLLRRPPRTLHDRRPALAAVLVALVFLGACGGDAYEFTGLNRNLIQVGEIQGVVRDLDQAGTPPQPGLVVRLSPDHRTTVTDAQGFYRFTDLLPGTYQVTALRPGNIFGFAASANATVVGGQITQATIEFGQGPGNPNAAEVVFLSSNGTNMAFFTKITGTDITSTTLNAVPAPLVNIRFNRARPTEFVVEAQNGGNSGVFLVDPTSGVSTTVIDTANPETHPDLSPDGARVVYAGDKDADGNFELYVLNRDGTGEQLLVDDFDPPTGGTFDSRDPAWSPDGVSILFASRRTDLLATADERDYEIQVVQATGGPIQTLTTDLIDDRDPAWHPNSTTIVYSKQASGFFQLFVSTAQVSTAEMRLTNDFVDDRDATLSLDGRFVAWISQANLGGGNPDGSPELNVAELVGNALSNRRLLSQNGAGIVLSSPDFRPGIP